MKQFKAGDRVVCVNDDGWGYTLKKGQEYEVVRITSDGFVRVKDLSGQFLGGFEPRRFEHLPRLTGTPGPDCNTCWVDGANTSRPRHVCTLGCVPPRKDLMARPAPEDAFELPLRGLPGYPLVYLATPYSKYPAGIEQAFKDASKLAARLLREGVKVYSPIAHTHPLAVYGEVDPYDHSIWMPFDEAMMTASAACVVATMPTWEQSKGIAHEIEFFRKARKPVFYLNPETLKVTV